MFNPIIRRRFIAHGIDQATELRTHEDGTIARHAWSAPFAGGYVRCDGRQVCERFSGAGSTLTWSPGGRSLAEMLRREWRRARDAERREYQREMPYSYRTSI